MKKKIFLLLVAVLSIATNLWALDAPTMPEFVAPQSGATYYLYNVESGLWMTTTKNRNVSSMNSYCEYIRN